MLVVQSILVCYGIDLLEYLKSIIDGYLCNGETSDSEVNKIIIMIMYLQYKNNNFYYIFGRLLAIRFHLTIELISDSIIIIITKRYFCTDIYHDSFIFWYNG